MTDSTEEQGRLAGGVRRLTADVGANVGAMWRGAKGLSRWKKAAIVVADILLVGVLGYLCYKLGVATSELFLFCGLQFLFFFVSAAAYFGYANAPRDLKVRPEERVVAGAWDGGAFLLVLGAAVAIYQRVEMGGLTLAAFSLVVLAILVALFVSFRADTGLAGGERGRVPSGAQVGTVLIVVSFLLAWFVTSVEWWSTRPYVPPVPDDFLWRRVKTERRPRSRQDLKVAVTLSGGGYRAAAFHAGVLRALEGKIPIDYLSTNSGGSIIGSYYALGHTPDEFLERLEDPPRLPNDFFSIGVVLGDAFWPGYTRGDAYAEHFDRILFAGRVLGAPCWPTLLVNVTDYQSGRQKVYECSIDSPDKEVRMARAVAASGALPIIAGSVLIKARHNLDGAARDNLGYVGLEAYFKEMSRTPPRIIVISNATLPLAPREGPQKIWLGEGFLRGYLTLLDEARTRLLQHVLAGRYMVATDTPDLQTAPRRRAAPPRVKELEKAKAFHINLDDVKNPDPELREELAKRNCGSAQAVQEAPTLDSLHELSKEQAKLLSCIGDAMATVLVKTKLNRLITAGPAA